MLSVGRAGFVVTAAVAAALSLGAGTHSRGPSGAISITAQPVPLNPQNLSEVAVGGFTFAGGLLLTSSSTDRLHAMSDLEVTAANRLTAVSDFGMLLEGRLVLDNADRLVGLADARLNPLIGEDGKPLAGADAEGLAVLPDGDRLVSFEGRARILLYPANGGTPRVAPMPAVQFAGNMGMEALAADPEAGPDAYMVGSEISGETWSCRVSLPSCAKGPTALKTIFYGLVAMRRLPGGQTVYLLRTVDQQRRYRIILKIVRGASEVARLDLAPPMNTENFEGVAVAPRPNGGLRFYLISDDNGSARERTLLFAFDWQPS